MLTDSLGLAISLRLTVAAMVLSLVFGGRGGAQSSDPADSSQAIVVSPHHLLFTGGPATAALDIRNPSGHPRTVQVRVEFGYIDWPHGLPYDTTVIATNNDLVQPHDTVIAMPGPHEPFAGRWISGLPAQLMLAPYQTKHVILHFVPPALLPAGEYWARVVARIAPTDPKHGHNLDVRKQYAMPMQGRMAVLQDTCAVVYRKGTVRMGLAFGPAAKALIDSANVGGAGQQTFLHALWVRLPVKLTGNAPFVGEMQSTFQNLETGQVSQHHTKEYSIMKDGVMHWVLETDVLTPGPYTLTLEFTNTLQDSTALPILPMTPAKITFHFELRPAWTY